jgi:hypothetical protein
VLTVGRTYAGVLGPIAFLTVALRGWKQGSGVEPSLLSAWLALVAFAALGYVVGRLAAWIVEESVKSRINQELAAQETEGHSARVSTRSQA